MKKHPHIVLAYGLSLRALLAYYITLAIGIILMLVRTKASFWSALPLGYMASWGTHISNFAISYLLYTAMGLTWITQGVPRKAFVWLGVILLALNIIVEGFVSVVNTPDMVDALFGIVGVLAGGLALFLLDKSKVKIPPKSK